MIKVNIIDDHKIVVDGLERIISESGIACVTGKSYTATDGWQMLSEGNPNVLLLDIGLPDGNGIDLCPKIKEKYPSVNILMLTGYAEYPAISHVLNNGASGYVLKSAMSDEIIEGIKTVANGQKFLCEEVNLLIKNSENSAPELTGREYELLRLIVDGYTSLEIAKKMFLGFETIRSYRKNLYVKLNAHNTAELTKMAIEQKLV